MAAKISNKQQPRISEQLLHRHILNSQNNLIVAFDGEGKFIFVNEAYCKLFHKQEDELLGKSFSSIVNPDNLPLIQKAMEDLYIPPYHIEVEQCVMTIKGKRWIQWEDSAITDESGKVIEIVAIGRDITKEKELLMAQKQTTALLEGIATATQALLINEDARYAIQQAIDILGMSMNTDRCYLFSIHEEQNTKEIYARQDFEWAKPGVEPQISNPELQHSPIAEMSIYHDYLLKGVPFFAIISNIKEDFLREVLESQQILSILMIPISIDRKLVAFIGFDDCTNEREWLETDIHFLSTASNAIGAIYKKEDYRKKSRQFRKRAEAALEASELGLWDWNIETNEVFYSAGLKSMIGYSDDEFANRLEEWEKRVHPDDLPLVFEKINDYWNGKSLIYTSEHRLLKKDGTYKWILDKGKSIEFDENGKPLRMIGTHTDIEAKQVRLLMAEESEANYRALVNSISDTIIILDNELMPVSYFGKPENSHIILQNIQSFDSKNEAGTNDNILLFKLEAEKSLSGESTTYKFESVSFDGNITYWHLSLSALRDDKNLITGVVVVGRDMTNLQTAETKLKESELKLREAQTIAKLANWEYDIEKDEMQWSEFMLQLLGIGMTNPSGNLNLFISLIHIDDRDIFLSAFNKILKTFEPFNVLFRLVKTRTLVEYVECKGVFFPDSTGRANRIVGTVLDITHLKYAEKALKESEEHFRNLFTSHAAIMLLVDPETGKIFQANLSAENFYGYSMEQICSMNIADINALNREQIEAEMKEAVRQHHNYFIFPHLLANGETRTVEVHSSPITVNNQTMLFSIIHDITERKQAEKLLEQTRQNYEIFFNAIDEFLFILDDQGNIIHTNATVINRLGYSREELRGQSVLMTHPPARREEAGRIVGEMLSGVSEFCPVPLLAKSGVQIPVETRVTAGVWNGEPALFGVSKDISKMTLSEEKFSKVFFLNPSACGLSDLITGEYLEVNEAFYALFGFSKKEVIGKNAFDLGIMTDETKRTIMKYVGANGKITNVEVDLNAKDGSIKHVLISAENINIQDKTLRYTVVNDITERRLAEDTLRRINQRLEAIIATSPDGIGMISFEGKLEMMSDKLAEMYGYSKEQKLEVIGKSAMDFIDPSYHQFLKENIHKLLTGKSDHKIREYLAVKKDNSRFYVDINYSVLSDINGSPVSILFVERDITERKQAEETLRQSEEKFRTMVDASPDPIGLFNAEGNVLMMNPVAVELFGYENGEAMVGKNALEFFLPDDREKAVELIQKVFVTGMIRSVEFPLLRKNGSSFSSEFSCSALYEETGKPKGILAFTRDITERKMAEDALQSKTALLEAQMDATSDGILVVDGNRKRVLMNQRFAKMFNVPEHILYDEDDLVLFKYVLDLTKYPDKFNQRVMYLYTHITEVSDDEVELLNGMVLDRYSAPVLGQDRKLYGRIWVFRDITRAKLSEKKIKDALEQEIALNEMKSQFISTASHEFRTPLTSILSSAELLEHYRLKWSEEKTTFHLKKIQRSVLSLQGLLNDVIFLNRAELGKTPLELKENNLREFCDQIIDEYLLSQKYSSLIEYSFNLSSDFQIFDQKLLRQILTNLIGNAIKYSPDHSPVIVKVEEDENGLQFVVSDKGIGIPEEEHSYIFDTFFRARNGTEIEGTGLGLPIVKRGVESLGGNIRFISKENEGTTFFVHIPYLTINSETNNEKENINS